MSEKFDTHGMYRELAMLQDEEGYEAFLRKRSLAKDHSFLLASISRSNLNPAVRKLLEELIKYGKIRRPKHGRPRRSLFETQLIGLQRALCVLDLEAEGWKGKTYGANEKRKSAVGEASKQLGLSYSTIEKAVLKYGPKIKSLNPEFLKELRAAFK